MNDSEKTTLRLEVEKLRRGELEWLQALVHILDHVFALHTAAMHSGDVKFAAPSRLSRMPAATSRTASASRHLPRTQ